MVRGDIQRSIEGAYYLSATDDGGTARLVLLLFPSSRSGAKDRPYIDDLMARLAQTAPATSAPAHCPVCRQTNAGCRVVGTRAECPNRALGAAVGSVVRDGVEGVGDEVVEDLLDRAGEGKDPQVRGALTGEPY